MNDRAIVLDCGGATTKVGYAGDDAPSFVCHTIVGEPKCVLKRVLSTSRGRFCGDTAQRHRGMLDLTCPVERDVVVDWIAAEELLEHAFTESMRVDVAQRPILLCQPNLQPWRDIEQWSELLLESFAAPATKSEAATKLAAYAVGLGYALSIHVGDGTTTCMNVYEGYTVDAANKRVELGGVDVTRQLARLLDAERVARNVSFQDSIQLTRDVKEQMGCVSFRDRNCELQRHTLPDGQVITATWNECGEVLFNPSLIGSECLPVPRIIQTTIAACDIDIRKELWGSIVVSGGCTLLSGFVERLQHEMERLRPAPTVKLRLIAQPSRKDMVWIGGSILASLQAFQQKWITRHEWLEHGERVVRKKTQR